MISKEVIKEIKKNYYEKNKEKINEYNAKYKREHYAENREKILKANKEYYEKNKEKLRAKYNERNRNSNAKKVAELREQGVTNPWRVIKGYEAKYKKELKKE